MNKVRRFLSLAFATALLIGLPSTANAGESEMQDRVEEVLSLEPGGVQVAWNVISWEGGDITLTLDPGGDMQSRASVGRCASGKYCAFSQANTQGLYYTYSTCGPHSINPSVFAVKSLANARSSGNVTAKNGSATVLTVNPGTYKNTTATVKTVQC